jgi:alpha-N-arabinofuranosidase
MSDARLRIWPAQRHLRVPRNLFGLTLSHLGSGIHDGLWVGPKSRIPNNGGLRMDVIAALKQLRTPFLRWPDSAFAQTYDWRDGTGPAKDRPRRLSLADARTEDNAFGTLEFADLCDAVDAAPCLTANTQTLSALDLLAWLDYCNYGEETSRGAARIRHGRSMPCGVAAVDLSAEVGQRTPDVNKTRRQIPHLRGLEPQPQCLDGFPTSGACCERPDAADLMAYCRALAPCARPQFITVPGSFQRGEGAAFRDREYQGIFADVAAYGHYLDSISGALAAVLPREDRPKIAVTEWGMHHPEATPENGFTQAATVRDALFAVSFLHTLARRADTVTLANLSGVVNNRHALMITLGNSLVLTPSYYVIDMLRSHMGVRQVRTDLECDHHEGRVRSTDTTAPVPVVDCLATRTGKRMTVTAVNQSLDQAVDLRIEVRERPIGHVTGRALQAEDPRAENTKEAPRNLVPQRLKPTYTAEEAVVHLPPFTVAVLHLTLE